MSQIVQMYVWSRSNLWKTFCSKFIIYIIYSQYSFFNLNKLCYELCYTFTLTFSQMKAYHSSCSIIYCFILKKIIVYNVYEWVAIIIYFLTFIYFSFFILIYICCTWQNIFNFNFFLYLTYVMNFLIILRPVLLIICTSLAFPQLRVILIVPLLSQKFRIHLPNITITNNLSKSIRHFYFKVYFWLSLHNFKSTFICKELDREYFSTSFYMNILVTKLVTLFWFSDSDFTVSFSNIPPFPIISKRIFFPSFLPSQSLMKDIL